MTVPPMTSKMWCRWSRTREMDTAAPHPARTGENQKNRSYFKGKRRLSMTALVQCPDGKENLSTENEPIISSFWFLSGRRRLAMALTTATTMISKMRTRKMLTIRLRNGELSRRKINVAVTINQGIPWQDISSPLKMLLYLLSGPYFWSNIFTALSVIFTSHSSVFLRGPGTTLFSPIFPVSISLLNLTVFGKSGDSSLLCNNFLLLLFELVIWTWLV